MFEDELIPLFEKCGKIYDLRLMMDPLSGTNRGYAFVTYTTKEEAERATVEVIIIWIFDICSWIYVIYKLYNFY